MTKTALANKELETKKELQDREFKWKGRQNKKDRINRLLTGTLHPLTTVLKNDPALYKRYVPDISKYVNLPTYKRLGTQFSDAYTYSYDSTAGRSAIPGAIVYHYEDTVGPQERILGSSGQASLSKNPVNQILMRTKEQVLKSNSRSSVNWEAADMGLNIFATASVITFLAEYRRAILAAQTYNGMNRYLGETMLKMLGVASPIQFISELPQHRRNYEILASRFNKACVAPADITLYTRKWYLASNVFADSKDLSRPQYFMFINDTGHVLNSAGDKLGRGGPLVLASAQTTYNQISSMITAIVETPDYQEMYADLRSAFGDKLLKIVETIDGNEELSINTETLNREQIRNMRTLPVVNRSAAFTPVSGALDIVSGVAGYLYQGNIANNNLTRDFTNPSCFKTAQAANAACVTIRREFSESSGSMLFNADDLSSANGDFMLDATRFNAFTDAMPTVLADTGVTFNISNCGTEVVTYGSIFKFGSPSDELETIGLWKVGYLQFIDVADTDETKITSTMKKYEPILYYTAFDWAPIMKVYYYTIDDNPSWNVITIGDMVNSFPVRNTDICNINEACVLSELYIDSSAFKH